MAYITVSGEVNRVFFNGRGISVKESFTKRDGEQGASYYTAWFEEGNEPGLSEGDKGKFSGLHGVKLNSYEKDGEEKTSIDVSLNNAKFEPSDDDGDDGAPF